MATITDCRAIYGLSAVGTPTSTGVDGTVTLGVPQTMVRLTDANVAYSLRAIFAGSGDVLALALITGSTTGSTAWVAGTAQVETATVTAASGITGSGNATVTVTATGMTGTPKAISVALTTATHTTATLIATSIAAALNADADYSAMFTATSSGATVITTRKVLGSFTVPEGTLNIYAANISNLNVAIANGTCTGITTAGTSANTTAGVATDGVKIYDGDGNDFEGNPIDAGGGIMGMLTRYESGGDGLVTIEGSTSQYIRLASSSFSFICFENPDIGTMLDASFTITSDGISDVSITIIGISS